MNILSKYTTEIRFICETAAKLSDSKGYNDVNTIISNALPTIFSFDFPIFDEKYRSVLETKIVKHYYTREICEETVGLWKLRLDTKLNEIMPYYNKLYNSELLEFNPLYTVDLTRNRKTDFDSNQKANENTTDATTRGVDSTEEINSESNTQQNQTNTDSGSDLYSDTPQGSLSGVSKEAYLTNARKTDDKSVLDGKVASENRAQTTASTKDNTQYNHNKDNTSDLTSTEDYLEHVTGYEGTSASDLLLKYRETFLNIDMMIIEELEGLFLQLW